MHGSTPHMDFTYGSESSESRSYPLLSILGCDNLCQAHYLMIDLIFNQKYILSGQVSIKDPNFFFSTLGFMVQLFKEELDFILALTLVCRWRPLRRLILHTSESINTLIQYGLGMRNTLSIPV